MVATGDPISGVITAASCISTVPSMEGTGVCIDKPDTLDVLLNSGEDTGVRSAVPGAPALLVLVPTELRLWRRWGAEADDDAPVLDRSASMALASAILAPVTLI